MTAQAQTIGQFSHLTDIGPTKSKGSLTYRADTQNYQMSASGANMWFDSDELTFAYRQIEGDFIVRAQVSFVGEGVNPHRKIGWHVRESLDPGARHVLATTHGDGLTALQFRDEAGADTREYRLALNSAQVLQLERRGDTFIMSAARLGEPFQVTAVSEVDLPHAALVGLALCAHDADVTERAEIANVRFIKPAPDDFVPYQDYIGSNLEILDMETFNRRIIHRADNSIQAPNWTRDGKALIYNADGLLYRYELTDGQINEIDTGFADANNNDHVLSWDGKTIGISHHAQSEQDRSTIYTLPLAGSDTPRQITRPGVGHSYLHGFAPDDRSMVFTAERGGQYDIYSVAIDSGAETQLTDTQTLDDGAEYSPDGQFIYFNSNRTGTMQLWRMNADGSEQTQLTFDRYNDWFPHVSPDGETLVFLSYGDEVDSGDHPFYKRVYLRQMPAEGGEPRVIGYLYGGQGSLNVHSWSPDGSRIAFVSNTQQPSD